VRLYHADTWPIPGGPLTVADEEDCYTEAGRRRGIWLSSEPIRGSASRTIELPATLIRPFETTVDGDPGRTFVVPADAIGDARESKAR
jgi:hypothetical protein